MQNRSLMSLPAPVAGRILLLTAVSVGGPLDNFFLCTSGRNDLSLSRHYMFSQMQGSLIVALCGLVHRIGS